MNCTCDLNVRNVGGIAFVDATNGLEREEKSLHASLDCFIEQFSPVQHVYCVLTCRHVQLIVCVTIIPRDLNLGPAYGKLCVVYAALKRLALCDGM